MILANSNPKLGTVIDRYVQLNSDESIDFDDDQFTIDLMILHDRIGEQLIDGFKEIEDLPNDITEGIIAHYQEDEDQISDITIAVIDRIFDEKVFDSLSEILDKEADKNIIAQLHYIEEKINFGFGNN